MVPAAHVPSLDPAMTRVSSLPLEAENTGRDPLRSVEATGLLAKGNGDGRIGNGAPDLSARPTRSIEPQRVRAEHAAFTKPKISFMPKPEYPPAALRDRIEGDVSVKVTFGKNGNVIFRGLVRQLGNEELNSAARETVQQIRFAPATRDDDGVPVDQDAVITVTFRLTQMTLTASF
jgi:TonB family protein